MTSGQYEAVAVWPIGVRGVVLQELRPEDIGGFSEAEGSTRVPGVRLLHTINRQRANSIDTKLVESTGRRG